MKSFLYKFDDGSVDEDGKSNAILLISSYTDEADLRAQCGNHDHGGMPQEDFERVWDTGQITKVTSLNDIPDCWKPELNPDIMRFGGLPYVSDEIEDVEYYPEEFVELMDENFSVDVRPWDWYKN